MAQAQVSLVLTARPPHFDYREMVGAFHAAYYFKAHATRVLAARCGEVLQDLGRVVRRRDNVDISDYIKRLFRLCGGRRRACCRRCR
jgi:hypothetical protein